MEALRWYRLAAHQGSETAMHNLALCFEQGLGVQKNQFEALRWYRLASNPLAPFHETASQVHHNGLLRSHLLSFGVNEDDIKILESRHLTVTQLEQLTLSDLKSMNMSLSFISFFQTWQSRIVANNFKFHDAEAVEADEIFQSSNSPIDPVFSPASEPPDVELIQHRFGKFFFVSIALCSFVIGIVCFASGISGLSLDAMAARDSCGGPSERTVSYSLVVVGILLNIGFAIYFIVALIHPICQSFIL